MNDTVLYNCPFVPAEWIAAHGLRPARALPARSASTGLPQGLCAFAGEWLAELKRQAGSVRAAVLTTVCDQMRRLADLAQSELDLPLFVMHVPHTWQSPAAHRLYVDELKRLGRFLVRLGGREPTRPELAAIVRRYDEARMRLRGLRGTLSPAQFIQAIVGFGEDGPATNGAAPTACDSRRPATGLPLRTSTPGDPQRGKASANLPPRDQQGAASAPNGDRHDLSPGLSYPTSPPPWAPSNHSMTKAQKAKNRASPHLALVGGPMMRGDHWLHQAVSELGGEIVLDATESGELGLAGAIDRRNVDQDPLGELAAAYFGQIPHPFRRPNSAFYAYLARELPARGATGILFRRYVWCDTWHGELGRLREWAGKNRDAPDTAEKAHGRPSVGLAGDDASPIAQPAIPVIDLDFSEAGGDRARILQRIQAMIETLQQAEAGR